MTPSTASSLDYPIHDADQHYYEPDDCYSRHIEAAFKGRTMWIDRSTEGAPGRMYVGEDRCHFFSVGAGDSIGAPGMMKAFLQGTSDEGGSPSLSPMNALAVPEFVDAKARLTRMDEQGVESCLMLPTTGAGQVLNGSDYPHPEGLADPIEFVEELAGLNDPEIKPIMRDNFASLVA